MSQLYVWPLFGLMVLAGSAYCQPRDNATNPLNNLALLQRQPLRYEPHDDHLRGLLKERHNVALTEMRAMNHRIHAKIASVSKIEFETVNRIATAGLAVFCSKQEQMELLRNVLELQQQRIDSAEMLVAMDHSHPAVIALRRYEWNQLEIARLRIQAGLPVEIATPSSSRSKAEYPRATIPLTDSEYTVETISIEPPRIDLTEPHPRVIHENPVIGPPMKNQPSEPQKSSLKPKIPFRFDFVEPHSLKSITAESPPILRTQISNKKNTEKLIEHAIAQLKSGVKSRVDLIPLIKQYHADCLVLLNDVKDQVAWSRRILEGFQDCEALLQQAGPHRQDEYSIARFERLNAQIALEMLLGKVAVNIRIKPSVWPDLGKAVAYPIAINEQFLRKLQIERYNAAVAELSRVLVRIRVGTATLLTLESDSLERLRSAGLALCGNLAEKADFLQQLNELHQARLKIVQKLANVTRIPPEDVYPLRYAALSAEIELYQTQQAADAEAARLNPGFPRTPTMAPGYCQPRFRP